MCSEKAKGLSGLPEGFLEQAPPPDQLDPAHVLCRPTGEVTAYKSLAADRHIEAQRLALRRSQIIVDP
jgi:hypothetical protein